MIALRAYAVIAVIAAAVAFLAIAIGRDFFLETLGLPPEFIGACAMLLVLAVAIPVLWWKLLRNWARRPDKRQRD